MNLYKKNTSPRNFRYQPFPQAPFVPEAPYSGVCPTCYGKAQEAEEKKNKMNSAGIGLLIGIGFLLFLPVLVSQAEADMKQASKG